jgi:hypothetical protein
VIVAVKTDAKSVPVWFEKGEKLPVLAIMLMLSGGPKFLLWSNKQLSVGLFPIAEFDVVDPTLPGHWVAKTGPNGHIEFSPAEWQPEGFWERYHEEDPEAVKIFQKCRDALIAETLMALP